MFGTARLGIGAQCPRICGHGGALVLVFARDWYEPDAETLEAIRAELRGLGASLLVQNEASLFYFRPDDELDSRQTAAGFSSQLLQDLARNLGVGRGQLSSSRLTLCVLDDEGALRFRITRHINDSVPTALLQALQLAGRSVLETGHKALLSRRDVVIYSLVGALTLVLTEGCHHDAKRPPAAIPPEAHTNEVPIVLTINGKERQLSVEPRVSLLDALREHLQLTGTKKGCDHGQCGACTVLIDDRRVNACLTLAIMAQNKHIVTIEGLAQGDALHPMQDAFIGEDALQCGYCTPGQIVSAVGLVKENRAHSDDEVREQMSGNICRCGAYLNIVRAIQKARKGIPV